MCNIILIGMMGSGKSTIAKALKKEINYDIFDMDTEIEKAESLSINEIFSKFGEVYFRQLENRLCRDFVLQKNIISTGGGVILNPENVSILKKKGKIIYLKGSLDVLYQRLVTQTDQRPLLDVEKLRIQLKDILAFRGKLYENSADVVIDINDLTIDNLTREIINNLIDLGYKF